MYFELNDNENKYSKTFGMKLKLCLEIYSLKCIYYKIENTKNQ